MTQVDLTADLKAVLSILSSRSSPLVKLYFFIKNILMFVPGHGRLLCLLGSSAFVWFTILPPPSPLLSVPSPLLQIQMQFSILLRFCACTAPLSFLSLRDTFWNRIPLFLLSLPSLDFYLSFSSLFICITIIVFCFGGRKLDSPAIRLLLTLIPIRSFPLALFRNVAFLCEILLFLCENNI